MKIVSVLFALLFSVAAMATPKKVKCEFNAREDRHTRILNGTLDGEAFTITEMSLLNLFEINQNPVQVTNLRSMIISTTNEAGDSGGSMVIEFPRGLHRGKSLANMDFVAIEKAVAGPTIHYRGSCFLSDRN